MILCCRMAVIYFNFEYCCASVTKQNKMYKIYIQKKKIELFNNMWLWQNNGMGQQQIIRCLSIPLFLFTNEWITSYSWNVIR